jgi:hypothetical protein
VIACPPSTTSEPPSTTSTPTTTTTTTTETTTTTGPVPKYLSDAYVSSNAVNTNASLMIKGTSYPDSLTIACVFRSKYPAVFNVAGYSQLTAMVGVADDSGEGEVIQNIPCHVKLMNEAGVEIWTDTFLPSAPRSVVVDLKGATRVTFLCQLESARDGYNSGSYRLGFGDAVLT